MIESLAIVLLTVGVGIGGGFVTGSGHLDPESAQGNAYSVGFRHSQQLGNFVNQSAVFGCSPEFQAYVLLAVPTPTPIVPTKEFSSDIRTIALRESSSVVSGSIRARVDSHNLQHTLNHWNCGACEESRLRAMQVNLSPSLLFRDAAEQWRESRRHQLSEGSYENYRQYIKSLNEWFGELRLSDIHIGHVEQFQEERQKTAGPSRINHEMSTLQQILKRAKLWGNIREYYEPLRLPDESVGFALEMEEEDHLFKVASSRPRWKTAYCCALITNSTTIGPKEILRVKIGDVFLDRDPSVILIQRGVKNRYRVRTIPVTGDAKWAISELLQMAHKKGSYLAHHYLLPGRPQKLEGDDHDRYKSHYDPLKPMGSYRKAWEALRKEAGKKFPRLDTIRRYDLRHNACTKLLEDPRVSERTIEEMMGHKINSRTKERYSHIRMQRKLAAVEILNTGHVSQEPQTPRKPAKIAGFSSLTSTTAFILGWPK